MSENGNPLFKDDFIFVYGTLRKKAGTPMHHFLARHGDFFSYGHIKGQLFWVDHYPGAIESDDSNEKVYGEIYTINNPDRVLSKLDEFEGCTANFLQPHEYIRKKLIVNLPKGGWILAWGYIYNRDVTRLKKITSGDFLDL